MTTLSHMFVVGGVAASIAFSTLALAAQPVPKLGPACPSGYRDEPKARLCVPSSPSAKAVIAMSGSACPSGFRAEPKTGYCIGR